MYCIFWQPAFSSEPPPPQTGHNFTGQKGLFNPQSRETRNLGGIDGPIPRKPVSPCPSHMAERALIEWRSRLFKPCFSICSSGALHLVNWPPAPTPSMAPSGGRLLPGVLGRIRVATLLHPLMQLWGLVLERRSCLKRSCSRCRRRPLRRLRLPRLRLCRGCFGGWRSLKKNGP